jgi:hypothetical protein
MKYRNRYSDEIHDKRVVLLLSYCLYRDQNMAVINDNDLVGDFLDGVPDEHIQDTY